MLTTQKYMKYLRSPSKFAIVNKKKFDYFDNFRILRKPREGLVLVVGI